METFNLKLAAFATLLLVAFAEGSMYRTTITTTEVIEDDNSVTQTSERCRREVQQHQHQMSMMCRSYIESGRGGTRLMLATNQGVPRQCCETLRQMMEDVMSQRRRGGKYGGQEEEEEEAQMMVGRAENLPSECGFGPRHCQIRMGGTSA
ncbi:hypothetical protein QJS10_CPA10g00653 [Acorus calamus]|uniref:Bifunctional inhibitor/plant lipid transfer protein/seed storage helical domain-containing protein n=1 Tax=Acorus calamus TaxID=4465 RepID=A0AAV9DXG7_ACOCL|nr:hypothetical protein QJS10_CPA10g00653 [Acorus calamus]